MKRIHFADDGITVVNVSLVDIGADGESGCIDVADDVPVGPGMVRVGDGWAPPPRPITDRDVEARALAHQLLGYAPPQPDLAGERLQLRGDEDKLNWLGLKAEVDEAIRGGHGDVVGCEFRCASNARPVISYADARLVLLGLLAWAKALQVWVWDRKDALAAGESVDLDSGLPG